jgi:hypothetical protein
MFKLDLRNLYILLAVLLAPTAAGAAGGVPVLLDFENFPLGQAPDKYPSLTLVGAGSNFDGTPHFTIVQPPQGTASGTQALQSRFDTGGEFGGSQLTMRFDLAQSRVQLSTGLAEPQPNNPAGAALLLQGFEQDPATTPGTPVIAQAITPCLGSNPTPVTTPLELLDTGSRIRFGVLSLITCGTLDPSSGGFGLKIPLDNLSYDRDLNPPPHENTAAS